MQVTTDQRGLSGGPLVHQFRWLGPLNNRPVQPDKRVITRSACGLGGGKSRLSRAGPCSLSLSSSHHGALQSSCPPLCKLFGGWQVPPKPKFRSAAWVEKGWMRLGCGEASFKRREFSQIQNRVDHVTRKL